MEDEKLNGFADELLDAALTRYRKAQPAQGLEERILGKLRHGPSHTSRLGRIFPWVWRPRLAAAVMGIVIGVAYIAHRHRPAPAGSVAPRHAGEASATRRAAAQPKAQEDARARPLHQPKHPPSRTKAAGGIRREPRQEQFPSPAPLTPEEKLLLAYVRQMPAAKPLTFHDAAQIEEGLEFKPWEPLRMEPLAEQAQGADHGPN